MAVRQCQTDGQKPEASASGCCPDGYEDAADRGFCSASVQRRDDRLQLLVVDLGRAPAMSAAAFARAKPAFTRSCVRARSY